MTLNSQSTGIKSTEQLGSPFLPVVLEGFNIKAEGGRDGVNVFAVDSLQNGCLAGIVKTEHQQTNLLFLLAVLFEDGEEAHAVFCCMCVCV